MTTSFKIFMYSYKETYGFLMILPFIFIYKETYGSFIKQIYVYINRSNK
jgi:hypothetical protein